MQKYVKISCGIDKKTGLITSIFADYSLNGKDIMKKGGKFYAVLNHETGFWSTEIGDAIRFIDAALEEYANKNFKLVDGRYISMNNDGIVSTVSVKYLRNWKNKSLKNFNEWLSNIPDNHNYIPLDKEITFKNEKVTPEMYRSKHLSYDPSDQSIACYDRLMSVLYLPNDREKIEWIIGSILCGESKDLEKALVIYGKPGSGKSTILDMIKKLLSGYWSAFVADELARGTNQFATALFKDNPLVAIQDDGKLDKINSPLINEIISHKDIVINEKQKRQYTITPYATLIMATNDPVDIHNTKLGITRRLLDVYPSGTTFEVEEYDRLRFGLQFEIPGIAHHCMEVYKKLGKRYYTGYRPDRMIRMTNYISNFLFDNLDKYQKKTYFVRDEMYADFKDYCESSGLGYPPKKLAFGEELRDYFEEFHDVKWTGAKSTRNVFTGFKVWKVLGITKKEFEGAEHNKEEGDDLGHWLKFDHTESILDKLYYNYQAQYASVKTGKPMDKWPSVNTRLIDIDTHKLHWFMLPPEVIKIDFDLRDENGNKSLERNIEAANTFPRTYAEISQSGGGVHLYYIYDGDPNELSRIYDEHIEIKTSVGGSSHRRILTKCNDLPIAHISTGLPLKGGDKHLVEEGVIFNEKAIRTTIKRAINKEYHGYTTPEINWICEVLDRAYESGVTYDVSDMRTDIFNFAIGSTNHKRECVAKISKMKFASASVGSYVDSYVDDDPIIFFDMEVYPNMNLLCWKIEGEGNAVVKVFNPTPDYISDFIGIGKEKKPKLVGYNNKGYDNHILWAIYMGYTPEEVYNISQAIIKGEKNSKFREAKNLSYLDVYEMCSKKQSLKKWEIQLGILHKEFPIPWDQPINEKDWPLLGEYCQNDVIATEAVFKANQPDYKGRQILCDLANIFVGPGSTVNDSTNDLTTRLIVGDEKNPQNKFIYPDLSLLFPGYEYSRSGIDPSNYISKDVIITGKSIYRGYDPGEGGFVWAKPGMYGRTISFDSASHHPSSLKAENGFGDEFTPNFVRLLELRLMVKHKEYDNLRTLYNGALAKYLETDADAKALSYALKIAINSVYGLTSAKFPNKLRDPRNIDNWVAKRGALFMIELMLNVIHMGYEVIHCKTDSIKVVNPDEKVANYISEFGKKFGYTFEIEHEFERICLVNDAVYVCKYTDNPVNEEMAGKWDATGTQFKVPYVFKTLFSHEDIIFDDVCETKSTTTAIYMDANENLPEGEHNYIFVGKVGRFCPMKPGSGGAELFRKGNDGKYSYIAGTKGYRWLESTDVKALGLEKEVDESYYISMVDKAIDTIEKFGDFEMFVSDEQIPSNKPLPDFMNIPETDDEEIPFIEDTAA